MAVQDIFSEKDAPLKIMARSHHRPTRPQGVSAEDFSTVLEMFSTVVGKESVSRDVGSGLENYFDPWSLSTASELSTPSAAVRPSTVDQVQKILQIANDYSIPLWTVSRGKNFGYGGSAPVVQGSVVLDLHLMNKIIEVNEEYAYAIVEPGVSFFDLYKYIQEHKIKLWMSCPALGWGSVVGNCLDRGFGYTPTGEHSQQQCGMEVVLPDGTVVRTGMGALKSQSTWALYKGGYGPSVDGLFYQSNLGIVTKVGMWLFPQPDAYTSCSVSVDKESDLAALVGTLSDLQRRNIIQNSPSISNLFRQAIVSAMDPQVIRILGPHLGHKDAIPEPVLEEVRAAKGWGWWKAQFAIYGPEPIVTSSWDYVKAAFAKVPGARCEGELIVGVDGQPVMTSDLPEEDIPHAGVPHLKNLALMDYRVKDSGHICFSPILPPSGRELYDWYLTSKQRTADAGFDFFADFHVFPRYINAIELVVFSEDEARRCDELYKILAQDAVNQGYSEYRTHVAYMDLIADHFDFNDSALRKYVEFLKDATDPKGVLSPGKQGIWGTSKIANMAKPRLAHTPRESGSLAEPRNGHL